MTPSILPILFAANTAVSNSIDLSTISNVRGLIMPPAWTPATVTIEGSADGINFFPMYDGRNATRLSFAAPPGTMIAIDPNRLKFCKMFRLLSGDRSRPIVQAEAREFKLLYEGAGRPWVDGNEPEAGLR